MGCVTAELLFGLVRYRIRGAAGLRAPVMAKLEADMSAEDPKSWYQADLPDAPGYPALEGDREAEVCIVGGGLAGLTLAMELARAQRSVVLLEAQRVAWGASGRNAGFVLPGFAQGMEAVVQKVGPDAAKALYRLSSEGACYVRDKIAELDPGLEMGRGFLLAMRVADEAGTRRYAEAQARDYGRVLEVWPAEKTKGVLVSPRYHEALYEAAGFHIQPLAYARALAGAAVKAGAVICEASPVGRLQKAAGGHLARTAKGSVRAKHLVLCTSGYGGRLYKPVDRAILPVATYIAVTEPLAERLDQAIKTEAAIADTRRAGDYYRRVAGDRLLWGGRITTRQIPPRRLAGLMAGDVAQVYPRLAGVRMDYAWSGLMGYSLHKMPLIGELEPGIWVASSFGGHGLNTTAMAGMLLAKALADGDDEWRRFAAYGARWGGGPFARIGVQATYWTMQALDRFDERRKAA